MQSMADSGLTPFCCPVCGAELRRAGGALSCATGHAFDLARQGYVNLFRRPPDTIYENAALFRARRRAFEAGFFDPLLSALKDAARGERLLDAGCGEGSTLRAMGAETRVGVDIARAAVRMAATLDPAAFWCVGDVCALPIAQEWADCVFNILTPANYAEFARVLAPDGLLIKIVPNIGHLAQIREAVGKREASGTPEDTLRAASPFFELAHARRICYTVDCDPALAESVFAMTPLTAHEQAPENLPTRVTVDLTLLVMIKIT